MIHEEIVTFEVCKLAKEKGFNAKCKWLYSKDKSELSTHCTGEDFWNKYDLVIAAPTQSLLQRWLREEKGIIVVPYFRCVLKVWSATYEFLPPNCKQYTFKDLRKRFKTYEQALDHALKYALERLN
jgi:hypothetical protein